MFLGPEGRWDQHVAPAGELGAQEDVLRLDVVGGNLGPGRKMLKKIIKSNLDHVKMT